MLSNLTVCSAVNFTFHVCERFEKSGMIILGRKIHQAVLKDLVPRVGRQYLPQQVTAWLADVQKVCL